MYVGLCGYPGCGKSTVFSALAPGARTDKGVSYGNIKVPDERVNRLARIFNPKKTVFAEINFVDVGGEPGAARGAFSPAVIQGMRNADVLVHVVRVFESPFQEEPSGPERDVRRFNDELLLLDLGVIEKRLARFQKEARKGQEVEVTERCMACLSEGLPLRSLKLDEAELKTLTGVQLLSLTPLITLYNLSEEAWADPDLAPLRVVRPMGAAEVSLGICGALEAEIATLDPADQREMLEGLGLGEPARNGFVRTAFALMDLISFLTCGPDECRAWPVQRGWNARRAAGRIHKDIERGFIRAEVYRLEELEAVGTEAALKAQGKIRIEGKEYVVQDGDIMNFRFNV